MNKNIIILIAVIFITAGAIAAYAISQSNQNSAITNPLITNSREVSLDESDNSDLKSERNSNESHISITPSTDTPGEYISYDSSLLTEEVNVIFFSASWCPTCRSLDRSISSEISSIPSDLTIFKADYDSEIELRRKYGVTYQHTLVQVDKDGNQIKKWNGSQNIEEIVSQLI